jgi:hypothetical protein
LIDEVSYKDLVMTGIKLVSLISSLQENTINKLSDNKNIKTLFIIVSYI